MQNFCYLGSSQSAYKWLTDSLVLLIELFGVEMIVDFIKHGFMIKYNNLSVKM